VRPRGAPGNIEGCCGSGTTTCRNRDYIRESGGVAALVGLLAPGGSAAVRGNAAGVLCKLCYENAPNKDSVRECGGIAALVALLAPGGAFNEREQAVGAVCNSALTTP